VRCDEQAVGDGAEWAKRGREVEGVDHQCAAVLRVKFVDVAKASEGPFCISSTKRSGPIIAGGNMNEAFGITHTFIFNPSTGTWSAPGAVGPLNQPRWYPTLALLSDGTLPAISGWSEPDNELTGPIDPDWVERIDEFNATTGTWTDFMPTFNIGPPGSSMQPHFYPFMIPYFDPAAPTARKLFFPGRATAAGDYTVGYSFNTYSLTFTSNSAAVWTPLGGDSDMQGSGAVIMINRTDPIDVGTVYKFGGVRNGVVVGRGRKIDLGAPNPGWTETAAMPDGQQRAECNVVAMADGRIAMAGGTTATDYHSLPSTGVNNIIIYNPATNTYDEISPNFEGTRMYHSVAVFSPTAKIFFAGGEYIVPNPNPPPEHIRMSNFTAQEYYPTYFMSESVRPVITASPPTAYWNTTISVTATGPVDHFSLLKLSSTTHANDMTGRYIKLTQSGTPVASTYQLIMPKNGGIAPPGNYMLFAVNTDGVPSVARYMHIGPA
jgi:hypothetical protein